uniref:CSON002029 protein n=1 Tax=Culicoides sonorensis TaxID=179676 RepID=A0A336MIG8_CULSO
MIFSLRLAILSLKILAILSVHIPDHANYENPRPGSMAGAGPIENQELNLLPETALKPPVFEIDSRFKLNSNYSLIAPFNEELYKFWLFRHAIISESEDRIILTPKQPSKWGAIWNLIPTPPNISWKAMLQYTAYNSKKEIADGIAFWLLQPGSLNFEPAHRRYGGNTNFTGLMIAIDSYKSPSNYSLKCNEDQATIIVVYNEHPRNDIKSGRCLVKNRYRNTTKIISNLVVEYADDVLKVYHTNGTQALELCTTIKNLKIPSGYLIGLSASNGGYVGAYEVHSFKFYDVMEYVKNVGDLQTNIYIILGLFISLTLICFIGPVCCLCRSRFKLNSNYSLIPPFDEALYNFWLFRNVTLSESGDRVILTPRRPSKWGGIWNLIPTPPDISWKAMLQYTAYNDNTEIADGIAFWLLPPGSLNYEPAHVRYGGPNTNFTGLMIAIDSYKFPSNYSLNRTTDQAAIIVVYNEKSRHFDWVSEGHDIFSGRCLVKNRYQNKTKIISKLVVEYADAELKIYHTNGTNELEFCTTVKNLKIPSGYLIGLSAGNGDIVGAYEVHSFKFYEDKNDPDSQRKLLTYLYIVSGLLIFVTLFCFISSVHFLRKRFCKKQSNDDEETEYQPEQIPTEILELERDRRNMRLALMRQKPVIDSPGPSIPSAPQRDSNDYDAIYKNVHEYDHLNWNNQSNTRHTQFKTSRFFRW